MRTALSLTPVQSRIGSRARRAARLSSWPQARDGRHGDGRRGERDRVMASAMASAAWTNGTWNRRDIMVFPPRGWGSRAERRDRRLSLPRRRSQAPARARTFWRAAESRKIVGRRSTGGRMRPRAPLAEYEPIILCRRPAMSWKVCHATAFEPEAHLVKGFLEHQGIPCLLESRRVRDGSGPNRESRHDPHPGARGMGAGRGEADLAPHAARPTPATDVAV